MERRVAGTSLAERATESGQRASPAAMTANGFGYGSRPVYLDRAVRQLRAQGADVPDDLLAHVAPLGWEHIGLTGDYVWTDPNPVAPFRPLREVRSMFLPLAA